MKSPVIQAITRPLTEIQAEWRAEHEVALEEAPQLRAARELAEKIQKRKVGADGCFCCRDVYLKGSSGLDTPEALKQASEVLQDAGWVHELLGESGPLGGRPSNRFAINPKVFERSNLGRLGQG